MPLLIKRFTVNLLTVQHDADEEHHLAAANCVCKSEKQACFKQEHCSLLPNEQAWRYSLYRGTVHL